MEGYVSTSAPSSLLNGECLIPGYGIDNVRRDHGLLRRLLRKFEHAAPEQRAPTMRLALDFFHIHSLAEDSGLLPQHGLGALPGLIQRQEETPPHSRLYYTRGLELKQQLEAHMLEEENHLQQRDDVLVPFSIRTRYEDLRGQVQANLLGN